MEGCKGCPSEPSPLSRRSPSALALDVHEPPCHRRPGPGCAAGWRALAVLEHPWISLFWYDGLPRAVNSPQPGLKMVLLR